MQFTPEKMNTEGDAVLVPLRCASRIVPPRPTWNPFTETLTFYNPDEHLEIANVLRNAPIQSGCTNQDVDDEEEKEVHSAK